MKSGTFLDGVVKTLIVIFVVLLMTITRADAQISPGDVLLIDSGRETGRGLLFSVNPSTGTRIIISNFADGNQGPLGVDPIAVSNDNSGNVLVLDANAGTDSRGALFRVNPANGARTLVSDFGDPTQGPLGMDPFGVATERSGDILVVDTTSLVLFRVNPSSGARTILSDFSNAAQGQTAVEPRVVSTESSGNILVLDSGGLQIGALLRVNPSNGFRTVVSDFSDSNKGPLGVVPIGLAIDGSGNALVVDVDYQQSAQGGGRGGLFRVNPSDGTRTIVSDFGDPSQGTLGFDPAAAGTEASGNILVLDDYGPCGGACGAPVLFRIDPSTGFRTVVTDFANPNQGPTGDRPLIYGLAIVPTNQTPVALCKNVIVNTAANTCSRDASVDNGSHDPDGTISTLVQSPPGPYNKGTTNVTLTVTDNQGASSSCTATVTVIDNQLPAITCPLSQIVEATGPNGAVAPFNSPNVSDNCPGALPVGCTATSGSTFPLGTTPVSCNVSDASTNRNTCGFNVTVQDTTPPTLAQPGNVIVNATSPAGAVVNYSLPVATDVVSTPTVTCNPPPGSTFPVGTTTVSCTAKDAANNVSTPKTFTITVRGANTQIGNLIALIQGFNLPKGIANSLIVKLQNASNALQSGNVATACNQLNAFINYVQSLSGNNLTVSQANQLITSANQIKAVLACA